MGHNIKMFHPKQWNEESGEWGVNDDAIFLMFMVLLGITIFGIIFGVITDTPIGLLVGAVVAWFATLGQGIMMRTHEMHGVHNDYRKVIEKIQALPPEYQAEFGSDYDKRIISLNRHGDDFYSLNYKVEKMHTNYLALREIEIRRETASDQLIESAERINEHIKNERQALTS